MTTNISSLNKFNISDLEEIDLRINNLLQKSKSGVWVYDNGNLVEGSPFLNISEACKAVGVGPRSSYLNTNKLVQKRFTFYSDPLLWLRPCLRSQAKHHSPWSKGAKK